MAAEFKIGRLRYTWKGVWATATFYNRDAVASYNGKTYVCIEPHTSTNFYANYYNIEPSGEVKPYWVIMLEGTSWEGEWQPSTLYTLGAIVLYGGSVYKCIVNHTSISTIVLTNWESYVIVNSTWIGDYSTNQFYKVGDVVKYGGIVYSCITQHTSSNSITYPTYSNWEILNIGIEYRGTWTPTSTAYKINDIVKYGPDLWISRQNHSSSLPFNATIDPLNNSAIWQLWMPGIDYSAATTWDATIVYQPGNTVKYGGYSYINLIVNNLNIVPSTNTDGVNPEWQLLTTGYDFNDDWSTVVAYKIGSVVRRGGNLFEALQDNTSQDPTGLVTTTTYSAAGSSGTTLVLPSTTNIYPGMIISGQGFDKGQFVTSVNNGTTLKISQAPYSTLVDGQPLAFSGVNGNYWVPLVPGTRWRNRWTSGSDYVVGDLAVWVNATYRCIKTHISDISTRPDINSGIYWVVELNHDYYNVLNIKGDMVVSTAGTNQALAIGSEGYLLKSVTGIPTWANVFQSPALYYVAPSGTDAVTSGDTWDNPYKTIKYACERIAAGTLNTSATLLLKQNKTFITEEAYRPIAESISTPLDRILTKRDIRYLIDAIIYDLGRGGNSQTVAFTVSFFDEEYGSKFITYRVTSLITTLIATFNNVFTLTSSVLNNVVITPPYQTEHPQITGTVANLVQVLSTVQSFQNIVITALTNKNVSSIPLRNQGLTATLMIKTGAYHETLPIVVPANTALNGDELRGVIVYPKVVINTIATRSFASTGLFTVNTTEGMVASMAIQFVSINPVSGFNTVFGGVTAGTTYYVVALSITSTQFSVSETPGGLPVTLSNVTGQMKVFGGDALKDMFRVQNGTGIRNMTLSGLLGTLTAPNLFTTRRPTGGSFVSLDPGTGIADTTVQIYRRSPYIQNVTTFGTGCVGLKIDGSLHALGNKSIVCNDFTQIVSDGVGILCTGPGALCEAVSVFSYYAYAGYLSDAGGRIRATNGNSSYGNFGVIAEGFDSTEIPSIGTVFNRYYEASATPLSALGATADILKLQYSHAGQNYITPTTNLLQYSNLFTNWTSDGNVTLIQSVLSPFANQSDAWIASGTTSGTNSSYFSKSITIAPSGEIYTNIAGINITGGGTGATFDIIVTSTQYIVSINNGGSGYVATNQIRILGSQLGGIIGVNDLIITVTALSGTTVTDITSTGTVQIGSIQPYTASIFCKQGTSTTFDLVATFSGYSTASSSISYNFITNTITPGSATGGMTPIVFSTTPISTNPGWVRLSFRFYDVSALNNTLQLTIYPRSQLGNSSYTVIYGAQLELGTRIGFYQETYTGRYTAYANYDVVGAGSGVELVADEIRDRGIYQTRVLEVGGITGGVGYKLSTNNAQAGTESTITIAGSDTSGPKDYLGMRVFVNSGLGAGQYGAISAFDSALKIASVLKESFTQLEITASSSTGNIFTLALLADVYSLYNNQPIQFVPTTYDTAVSLIGQSSVTVNSTIGGQINTMFVISTAQLTIDMPVTFSGLSTFGGVTSNFTYYITAILNDNEIQLGLTIGGVAIFLNTALGDMLLNYPSNTSYLRGSTSNMDINLPIYFTGLVLSEIEASTDYFINDIIDADNFTISETLVTPTATGTTAISNTITVDTSDTLVPLNPIKFAGTAFGGVSPNTKYYINHIVNSTQITVSLAALTTTATATQNEGELITVGDTAGFSIGNAIKFTGTTFGGIVNDRIYYISYINNATSLIISATSTALSITATNTSTSANIGGTVYNNVITVTSSGNLTPMYPVTFSGTAFGGITLGTTYYISRIYDSTRISIADSIISVTATETSDTSNLIHVASTAGFVAGNPIIFGGVSFGGIISGQLYYISAVNSLTDFTISTSPTGSAVVLTAGTGSITARTPAVNSTLSTAAGSMIGTTRASSNPVLLTSAIGLCIARTTGPTIILSTASGTLTGTSTTVKKQLTSDAGTMVGTFSVPILGGITQGTTYYVRTITPGTTNTFTITTTSAGATNVTLTDTTGSMKVGQIGWDHINPGTPLVSSFNSTSVYSIEPRIIYPKPVLTSTTTLAVSQAIGVSYISIGYGNGKFVGLANADVTLAVSTDATIWSSQQLPSSATWSSIAYGSSYWVIISSAGTGISGSKVLYSNSDLATWKTAYLPTIGAWSKVVYGNGKFVAITNNSASSAYSNNFGATWSSGSGLPNTTWSGLAYGAGVFVAVATGGTVAAISADGISWTSSTLPSSTSWSGVAYGNGRFVAVSSVTSKAAYSIDGTTWSQSLYNVLGTNITYGNGVFVLVGDESAGPYCYISEDGILWAKKAVASGAGPIVFGADAQFGRFVSVSGQSTAIVITAGSQTKSRASVVAGKIIEINEWDPGSNYLTAPIVTIVDANATVLASTSSLLGSGVLGNPTFINRGTGYNTNTTTITITGDGYAERFQTGLGLIVSALIVLPAAGDNLAIEGNNTIYKVTSATLLDGSITPNIIAEVFVSPEITVGLSPIHGVPVSIRTKYSQVRLTGHDFLNIGYGNFEESNYPLRPTSTLLSQENEAVDANYGRVFYSSSDQDGNFRVGKLFAVEQATGIITLSASQFGLSGLNELKIGGVAVGSNSVIITQFSTDSTFVANSNSIVPTQKAIKSYLGAKLTQGGSNTFTGQLIAGTILVGGPDKIASTIVEGNDGWHIDMPNVVDVTGVNDGNGEGAGGWDGDGMAMAFFQMSFAQGTADQ
jgi:hypothetical protein